MIFVTVGTQLPFDRLIKAVDAWTAKNEQNEVFAQIGPTEFVPANLNWSQFIVASKFYDYVTRADVIVAHAGMGSIISALEVGKPIIVMPRRADLGEHRNDHQMATAKRFAEKGKIHVAFDEKELIEKLDQIDSLEVLGGIGSEASPELIGAIRDFIRGEDVVRRLKSEG